MPPRRVVPPWDFLQSASPASLDSYELSRLNRAANLRKEIAALIDQWVEETSEAMLARWVRDYRALAAAPVSEEPPRQPELPFSDAAEGPAAGRGRRLNGRPPRLGPHS